MQQTGYKNGQYKEDFVCPLVVSYNIGYKPLFSFVFLFAT